MLLLNEIALCRRALTAYDGFDGAQITPLREGHTHKTYLIERASGDGSARAVLQRVSPILDRAIHDDIEAVTARLQSRGIQTPRLLRSRAGELCLDLSPNGLWRLMTFVPGRSHQAIAPGLARSAGALLGSFHAALAGLNHDFRVMRSGASDLEPHLLRLRRAVETAKQQEVAEGEAGQPPPRFATALLEQVRSVEGTRLLSLTNNLSLRLCHGDLRASKLRFDDIGKAVCLFGFDTLSWQPLPLELGDALRLWCNPSGEDSPDGVFDLDRFAAVLSGYIESARGLLSPGEIGRLVGGIERMAFQSAVRYTADWMSSGSDDSQRPAEGRAVYRIRAEGQLSLYQSVVAYRSRAESFVARLFRP